MLPGSSFYLLREMSRPLIADIRPFRIGSRPSRTNYAYRQLLSSNTGDSDLERLFLLSSPSNVLPSHDGHSPIQNGVSPFYADNGIIPDTWYELEYQHGKALNQIKYDPASTQQVIKSCLVGSFSKNSTSSQ